MSTLERELNSAEAIARLAGCHIMRERQRQITVSLKAHNDVVTNVDRSTEKLIVDHLKRAFPDDGILGEEFGKAHHSRDSTERTWLVDPIDGTLNFAHGLPLFCVSIGLQIKGQTCVSVIYDPNRDELFSAARGGGAHLNGEPLQVSDCKDMASSVLVTGFPVAKSDEFEWTIKQFIELTRSCRGIRRLGSAAIDLAYVASGRLDGFWEYGLKPWDTAAGYLLVAEAGGQVSDLDGQGFRVSAPGILATNGHIHADMLAKLQSLAT